jgi:putative ABC transport system permease protein
MNFLLTIRIALRAIAKNKLRAGLTVLGVVIGIAAVTTMVSIGQSAGTLVQNQLETFGTNVVVVFPEQREAAGVRQGSFLTLTAADSEAIAEQCPSVLAASPIVGASGQVIYGNNNVQPRELIGVGVDYLRVRDWRLMAGGDFFTPQDIESAAKICVVGKTIVEKLFQTVNPLQQTIRVSNIPFRIVGVLEEKGANMFGEDQDNVLLMPYTTMRRRIWGSSFDNVNIIMLSARSQDKIPEARDEIYQLLLERHRIGPGDQADFGVRTSAEIASVLGIITGTMTMLLASIAGISLLVGGVGIMNIMLVSVTERTREIGIRMAVGARPKDILRQFLVEAIMLSSIGGLVGIFLGVVGSAAVIRLINAALGDASDWPVVVSIPAALIAMTFAALVGIFFGYYPARSASRLDPIEALRYE